MKDLIRQELVDFVADYPKQRGTETAWLTPLVGFAAGDDPLFASLKNAVSKTHALPSDLLRGARTAVAFFLPFDRSVAKNNIAGTIASREWAVAYIETNRLINDINGHMKLFLESHGHAVVTTPPTYNFDKVRLISDWSHRHIAYIAGLGKFGLNNMFITERGCCGRLGSFITSLETEPDPRSESEACLYFHDGSCGKCVERCVNNALFRDHFDRHACYAMLNRNEKIFLSLGKAHVCGKCLVGIPCSFINPVKAKSS